MKTLKKFFLITAFSLFILFIFIIALLLMFWPKNLENYYQDIDYTQTNSFVQNPDQGFYRTVFIRLEDDGGTFTPALYDDFQMYHLRIDISQLSPQISSQAQRTLDSALKFYFDNQKNVILRFSYDSYFEGNINAEPQMDTIISHIKQLAEIINDNYLVVTAVEAGMIGPWGEMHSSDIATPSNINAVIDAWLEYAPNTNILVRTPKMIYDYLGISYEDITTYDFVADEKTSRLGLFNDAFLSTDSDMGTYTNRQSEIEWIQNNIKSSAYGGEALSSEIGLNDFPDCLDEMYALNLSYLNYEYDEKVISLWQNTNYEDTTAYDYIASHLGYRLTLSNSVFRYNSEFKKLEIDLTIQNDGFSNYVREKDIVIIFVDESGNEYEYVCGKYNGEKKLHLSLTQLPQKQNYTVYISLCNKVNDNKYYEIAFANNSLYNKDLGANMIGRIEF